MFEFVFPVLTENGWAQGLQAVLLAFVLDLLFGEPKWLYRHMPHPIVWIGGLIEGLEAGLLKDDQSPAGQIFKGGALVVIVVGLCAVAGMILAWVAAFSGYGWIITGVIGSTLIAARSLHDHVIAVGVGLTENLADGRRAVSHIVGRDPKNLDEAGVSRAALESLAENFSDGVVAPLFWFLVAGLPGLLAYKAINTLDSMVGHRNTRYLYFGRIAARLDDVVNWPAARITGLLFCLCALLSPGSRGREAWAVMWHEHGKHASPNAGWPEGAMAGALGIGLAGPRIYQGKIVDGAWLGAGEAGVEDISRGCRLYCWTCGLVVLVLLAGILV
ncbi:MAG: adenosylcobinamide-phosphate synthase CbiB [Alphaproteobacteria bacterium]|nr:adenosylcobinamide-phosphate synthase CbiB [Alphaproteobacteria bacterium]